MPLEARRDEEERLGSWGDVRDYAARKDVSVRWFPCTRGMRVSEDQFIETEDRERIYVSDRGWTSLCRSLGCDPSTMRRIESHGLATQVLNDAWNQRESSMVRRRIVVDGWTVVGVVGSRYQPYKHGALVGAIDELLGRQDSGGWDQVGQAWEEIQPRREIARTVGTELRITLPLLRHEHGVKVEGLGGSKPDVSWVGVEAHNGLGGECSVGMRTTVFRLVCANGMMRAAADHKKALRHTGEQSRLDAEVRKILGAATDGLGSTVDWLTALGERRFSAEDLARERESMSLVRQMLKELQGGVYWSRRLVNRRNGDGLPAILKEMTRAMAGPLSGAVWRSPYRNNATW